VLSCNWKARTAWEQAPESIKLEFEQLMRMIYSLTQTPDISFEAVKNLGSAASGESLKMLFLDAHLKVMDKLEIFDEYLQRRLNILKAFIGLIGGASLLAESKTLELTPEVTPFMVNDDATRINNLVTAVSGKIMSRRTAVTLNPMVTDAEEELNLLETQRKEEEASALALNEVQNDVIDE
jgi:SPP1 family phage portal protein